MARKVIAGSGDRDEVRRRLRALASILRDLGAIGARADERHLVNADLTALLRRLSGSFDGSSHDDARLRRSIARSRRSIATPVRRSSRTGWRFSCRPRVGAARPFT